MSFRERLVASWYAPSPSALTAALAPLAWLYASAASLRRALYRAHVLAVTHVPVAVIVVGNITVGGSGKTPLVVALARALAQRGFRPGIASRGYGRRPASDSKPLLVTAQSLAADVGDEPLLMARAGWPVAVARDRAAAARALADARCNVVLCDDGLQHYALARDVEIAVIDGARGLGNGRLLPAGPLREGRARLADVDAIVVLADATSQVRDLGVVAFAMTLEPRPPRRVGAPHLERPIGEFAGERVHAVAGIGNPDRFFAQLAALGMRVDPHRFADHHAYVASDLAFADGAPIVMTEKDAVKCEAFADERCWYLPVEAAIDDALVERIVEKL